MDAADTHDLARGIVDNAAGCIFSGNSWTNDYLRRVRGAGLGSLISQVPSQEKFHFGDGRFAPATEMITAIPVIARQPMMITWHSVDGFRLPLLLGRDFVTQRGALVDCRRNRLAIGNKYDIMRPSKNGHFSVGLDPEDFCDVGTKHHAQSADHTRRRSAGGAPPTRRALTAVVYALTKLREPALKSGNTPVDVLRADT